MKKLLLLTIIIAISSCGSDQLSNSKAKNIISDCLEKEPIQKIAVIYLNNTRIDDKNRAKYEKLADDGFIEMVSKKTAKPKPVKKKYNLNDPLEKWRYEAALKLYERELQRNKNTYDIKLTSKAQKYIENAPENGNLVKLKTFTYEVDKVLEVQEIPAMNAAKVKVQYKADDVTPFAVLSSKDPSEYLIDDLNMIKTSNGWKYCDNF